MRATLWGCQHRTQNISSNLMIWEKAVSWKGRGIPLMTTTLKGCSPIDGWVSLGISQRWGYLDHIGHWSTPLGVSVFLDNSMSLSLPCCSYSKTFPSAHSSHHVHEHETKHLWSRNSETVSTNSHSFIKYLLRSTVIRRGTEIGLFPVCYLVS